MCAHLTMSECLHIVVLGDSERKVAKSLLKNQVRYKLRIFNKNIMQFTTQNDVRIQKHRHRSTDYRTRQNKETVFLAVGLFHARPEVHNICMSVFHQLHSSGSVCTKAH